MVTYRLWPSSPAATLTADPVAYTMGTQFSVSQAATLSGVWFYSAAGAAVLPQTIALYQFIGSASLVHSETASWSGAAGSGWVRAAFASPPVLTAGVAYKAAVLQNTAANWYSATAHYWDTGPGSNGLTNGILSAPNNTGANGGQCSYTAGSALQYPATSFNATSYWIDPEVTTGTTLQGAASLAATPALTASATTAHPVRPGTAALMAQALLTATANPGPDLNALWAAYQAAALAASKARESWHMMRQAGGTDGTAGFLYQKAYIAERAEEEAYEAFLAAQRIVFPGARG